MGEVLHCRKAQTEGTRCSSGFLWTREAKVFGVPRFVEKKTGRRVPRGPLSERH